jgi:inorganic pyrophosphatase
MNAITPQGVVEIGAIIHEGATEFIVSEYKVCSIFISLIAVIVWACVDEFKAGFTTFAFLLGAVTSMACGAFGMYVATFSNYRTTICAKISLGYAFKTAYRAGVVIGFALVSVSLLVLYLLIASYKSILQLEENSKSQNYY